VFFVVSVYFFIDSIRKFLDTPLYQLEKRVCSEQPYAILFEMFYSLITVNHVVRYNVKSTTCQASI